MVWYIPTQCRECSESILGPQRGRYQSRIIMDHMAGFECNFIYYSYLRVFSLQERPILHGWNPNELLVSNQTTEEKKYFHAFDGEDGGMDVELLERTLKTSSKTELSFHSIQSFVKLFIFMIIWWTLITTTKLSTSYWIFIDTSLSFALFRL